MGKWTNDIGANSADKLSGSLTNERLSAVRTGVFH